MCGNPWKFVSREGTSVGRMLQTIRDAWRIFEFNPSVWQTSPKISLV
jgi:hypothetical protein